MKRRRTARPARPRWQRAVLAIGLLALTLPWILGSSSDPRFEVAPFLRDPTADGVTIVWETRHLAGTAVEYGNRLPLTQRLELPGRRRTHVVTLNGLDPVSPWFYRVCASTEDPGGPETSPAPLRVARRPGDPIVFAVVGDTQDETGMWGVVAGKIRDARPDLVLHVGDIVQEGDVRSRWVDEFFAPARRLLATTPIAAVLGNHDADTPLYYQWLASGERAWRRSFVYGDAEFFLLDSERDLRPGSEQHAWLDRALADSKARWKLVALHRPPVTSDRDDYGDTTEGGSLHGDPKTTPLVPLLEERGVDVLFCGHIHAYERSHPIRGGKVDEARGVMYVQTGGGGGHLEDSAEVRSWFTVCLRRCHHFLTVSLHEDVLELRAYDAAGLLFDQVVRRKAARGEPSAGGEAGRETILERHDRGDPGQAGSRARPMIRREDSDGRGRRP